MLAYAVTIFLGAFLLFQVQPLIAKYVLPWFGGGPGVWTTCVLFFQAALLAGYAYAHVLTRWCRSRRQAVVHLVVVVAALALLPIAPADNRKPGGEGNPSLQILWLLTACVGLPYFVLSATGPLLQEWFRRSFPDRSPYRLYALSNAGSLLALVSYPLYFEPRFTRGTQTRLWAAGLVAYALGCVLCAKRSWRASNENGAVPVSAGLDPVPPFVATGSPSRLDRILWVLLPGCASLLLLAITNKICLDIAVIPFLWVVPLGLYLLSFIICFDHSRWYARTPFTLLLVAALATVTVALSTGSGLSVPKQVGVYSACLFVFCLVCHGELYRRRPAPRYLTSFYLLIAFGGALGGVFTAVVAPLIFRGYYELHVGLVSCACLFVVCCVTAREPNGSADESRGWVWLGCLLPLAAVGALDWYLCHLASMTRSMPKTAFTILQAGISTMLGSLVVSLVARGNFKRFRHWRLLTCAWLGLGVTGLGVALWLQATNSADRAVVQARNFYGVLTVFDYRRADPRERYFQLQHGRITHGLQFVDPERAKWPTTYYGEESGVGLALRAYPPGSRKIGLVGLGTGTLAAYGRRGDQLRIYEINPEVIRVASTQFTYLSNCEAKVSLVLGDARLSLEREESQQFDVLVLDAFSSDAIPVHLLTREAFAVYGRHLKTNGVIAVHISNHFLDLEPVVANVAREFSYRSAVIDFEERDEEWWLYASTWVLLTRSPSILEAAPFEEVDAGRKAVGGGIRTWTDDIVSLYQILK